MTRDSGGGGSQHYNKQRGKSAAPQGGGRDTTKTPANKTKDYVTPRVHRGSGAAYVSNAEWAAANRENLRRFGPSAFSDTQAKHEASVRAQVRHADAEAARKDPARAAERNARKGKGLR